MKKKIYCNSSLPILGGLFILFSGIFMVVLIASKSLSGGMQNISSQLSPISPKEIVAEFCRLDGTGLRLSGDTRKDIEPLLAWGEEYGYDEIVVIKDFKVNKAIVTNSAATVSVEYFLLGTTDSFKFLKASKRENVVNFKLVEQNGLWRIEGPVIAPHVHWESAINHLRLLQKNEPVRKKQLGSIIKAIEKAAKISK